jgi:hypothetical protein
MKWALVTFEGEEAPQVKKLHHTDVFESKAFYSEEFVIPDSIQSISVMVPYYSRVEDGRQYDTLRFELTRTVTKRKSLMY